jgi:hypothetical protein
MSELYAPEDLALMERLRDAFDRGHPLNPCKVLPGGAGCGETHARGPARLGGSSATGAVEGPWM